jgi:hypothetical protein
MLSLSLTQFSFTGGERSAAAWRWPVFAKTTQTLRHRLLFQPTFAEAKVGHPLPYTGKRKTENWVGHPPPDCRSSVSARAFIAVLSLAGFNLVMFCMARRSSSESVN